MQKTAFYLLKEHLLHHERRPFAKQPVAIGFIRKNRECRECRKNREWVTYFSLFTP